MPITCNHTATLISKNTKNKALIFGGNGNSNVFYLDLDSYTVKEIENLSYPYDGHTANLKADNIYLFGGYNNGFKDDHYCFNIFSEKLKKFENIQH